MTCYTSSLGELIKRIPYIEYAIPAKDERGMVSYKDQKAYITVYGIEEDDLKKLYETYEGDIKLSKTAVVGYSLAETFGIDLGDKISIGESQFKVAGIFGVPRDKWWDKSG